MTNHREIKRIIYKLKRQWGKTSILSRETNVFDVDTGVETPTITATVTVKRAVLLPRKMITDFAYDLSFIAANKNFTYGGFFGKTTRTMLIDAKDLGTYVIAKQDYVVINSRRYVVEELDKYDEGADVIAYLLRITQLEADTDVV